MTTKLETAVPAMSSRYVPPEAFLNSAIAMRDSGVIDQIQCWDQLMYFWPPSLWNTRNAAMAEIMPDLDSFYDVFQMSACAVRAAPGLGTVINTDSLRRGPAELFQSMVTLSACTNGNSIFQIGAGEYKQCNPYGYKRSQGLKRLEDHFRAFHALWDAQGPMNFEGNHWAFQQAWVGAAHPHRPRLWGLGGGPKLMDLAATYADGFSTVVPGALPTPEHAAEFVAEIRRRVTEKGRDAEKFEIGGQMLVLLHEDENVLARAFENPVLRWLAATAGRLNQNDWDVEGIEPVFPRDWHYAIKMQPLAYTPDEVDDILDRTTPEMTRRSFLVGTPAEVAPQIQSFVDTGLSSVAICDMLPMVLELDDAMSSMSRTIEVCRLLKNPEA